MKLKTFYYSQLALKYTKNALLVDQSSGPLFGSVATF